jgi:transcriptional regulator with XRE-family HTH domain
LKEPFPKWIKRIRQEKGLTAQDCADRVNVKLPPKADGSPAISRSGWSWYEGYKQKGRVDPDTIKKVAIGLGEDESVVAAMAPQYLNEPTERAKFNVRFGRRLAAAREGKFTQEELAQRIGLTTSEIAKYESGESEPSGWMLRFLCQQLGMSANELLELTTTSNSNGEEAQDSLTLEEDEQTYEKKLLDEVIEIKNLLQTLVSR